MKKTTLYFWLDLSLIALLLATMTALLPGEIDRSAPDIPVWNLVHEICGMLMLAISSLHLALHWDWVKAVIFRPVRKTAQTLSRNKRTDLGLFVTGLVSAVTGLMVWGLPSILPAPLGLALTEWRDLHNWAGMGLLLLMFLHLALHWKWLTNQFQRRTNPQTIPALEESARSE